MNKTKLIIAGFLGIVAIVLAIQNTQPVNTRLLVFTITMPRAVLLLLMMLIGFVIGVFTVFHYSRKPKKPEQENDV